MDDERQDDPQPGLQRFEIEARVKIVGADNVPILYANHANARIDPEQRLIFLTFAQSAAPDAGELFGNQIPNEEMLKGIQFEITAPVIGQYMMPAAQFRTWIDNIIRSYAAWFGAPPPVQGIDE